MYQASAENWGDSRFVVTTRHSTFVTDTQGKGANPVDTLLASLCSCIGHYVRDNFAPKNVPFFRVSAETNTATDAAKLSNISVRIELGQVRLEPAQQDELLSKIEKCKIYSTLRQACGVEVAIVNK